MSEQFSVGNLAELLAAGAAIWAASIAYQAASDWKKGLERQRNDECIAAISNCAAAVGRVIKRKQMYPNENRSDTIQAVWDKWSDFRTSCEVARSYNPDLPTDVYARGENIIHNMEDACKQNILPISKADELNSEFGKLQGEIKSYLIRLYRDRYLTQLARKNMKRI